MLRERELLPDFLSDIFISLLGYTGPAEGGPRYTLSREQHVEVDGKFAEQRRFLVALEGKGPRDPLDRPFAGRRMSAVDQGYRYARCLFATVAFSRWRISRRISPRREIAPASIG